MKYRKNHGKKIATPYNADDDDEDDDLGPDDLESFNGVVISGHHSSSNPQMNIMKIDQGQVTYGVGKDGSGSSGGGKRGDQERNGPRLIPGIITSTGRGGDKVTRVISHPASTNLHNDQG